MSFVYVPPNKPLSILSFATNFEPSPNLGLDVNSVLLNTSFSLPYNFVLFALSPFSFSMSSKYPKFKGSFHLYAGIARFTNKPSIQNIILPVIEKPTGLTLGTNGFHINIIVS